jgi:hypothetical protein
MVPEIIHIGYCSVSGNVWPATGEPIPPGTFLNLVADQPIADSHCSGLIDGKGPQQRAL